MENNIIENVLCNRCGNEMKESTFPNNLLDKDLKLLIAWGKGKPYVYQCPQCNGYSFIFKD